MLLFFSCDQVLIVLNGLVVALKSVHGARSNEK
jgi:hypothetical protein